jgi:AmiR/NasT family two-component response regulator
MALMEQQNYILIYGHGTDDLQAIESLLGHLRCPLVVTHSVEQAMARATQAPPYLLILTGSQQSWSKTLVNQFRSLADACGITIVALTEVHAPSWLRQEDNPGVDGFLVKPLNCDILSSVIQSAWIRQAVCSGH